MSFESVRSPISVSTSRRVLDVDKGIVEREHSSLSLPWSNDFGPTDLLGLGWCSSMHREGVKGRPI